jgi:hypothetical protein
MGGILIMFSDNLMVIIKVGVHYEQTAPLKWYDYFYWY